MSIIQSRRYEVIKLVRTAGSTKTADIWINSKASLKMVFPFFYYLFALLWVEERKSTPPIIRRSAGFDSKKRDFLRWPGFVSTY